MSASANADNTNKKKKEKRKEESFSSFIQNSKYFQSSKVSIMETISITFSVKSADVTSAFYIARDGMG